MTSEPAKITTFLMFDGHAEDALTLYTSLFEDARILTTTRYGPDGPGREGTDRFGVPWQLTFDA